MNRFLFSCLNLLIGTISAFILHSCGSGFPDTVQSPDGRISVTLLLTEQGEPYYTVSLNDDIILDSSRLGIVMPEGDFSTHLHFTGPPKDSIVEETYKLIAGKKSEVTYSACRRTYTLKNQDGQTVRIVFQVSNDGMAYHYHFPGKPDEIRNVSRELSAFHFPEGSSAWIQPRASAKSGWNQVNPSYEEHYLKDTLLSEITSNDSGWVFPVLIKTRSAWVLLTESWPERNYCGSHVNKGSDPNELVINFPEPSEGFPGGAVFPQFSLPASTPWRIIVIGSTLATIAESTLGTDVAKPSVLNNTDYVKPGRAAWSWALGKDASVNYDRQKEYIDYAADMGWEYCLIDVNWNLTIGWEKIAQLVEYAASRDVRILIWYSSSGSWNTVPYEPKDRLLTRELRYEEFSRLQELGIKGIKVDFFGGDGQSMLNYYLDIFEDAHHFQLMVNCHGATLPRGIQRTYPNLVSMESVRGFEYATFGQETADLVPAKSTILPFTRNAFDPMDFTPVCFTAYDNFNRITGNGAELAQSVLFLSGVQHYAETPEGMASVPEYIRNLMSEIPVSWDETRFLDAYPGRYVILARRSGEKWYVAGINGTSDQISVEFEVPFINIKNATIYTEGSGQRSFGKNSIDLNNSVNLSLRPFGGFVIVAENK